jgi:hypothetical protein
VSDEDRGRQLENENAELRHRIATLRDEVIDLRTSALLWRKLYEGALRRLMERDKRAS